MGGVWSRDWKAVQVRSGSPPSGQKLGGGESSVREQLAAQWKAVRCTEPERQQLEALARAGSTPQKIARKCRVILLASQGVSNYSIAQQTDLFRPTVLATRTAFAQQGMESIRWAAKRKRSRPKLTLELEQQILDTTLKTRPPDGTH